jgi:hypothetical protein
MNQKQFLVLVILVVVLGAFGWRHWRSQERSFQSSGAALGQKLLGEFPVNDVAEIRLQHGDQELTLAKRDDLWRVAQRDNYPASFTEISSLMLKLRDLKVLQSEAISPAQLARMELAAAGTNHPIILAFHDAAGKQINQLVLGKKHLRKSSSGGLDGFDAGGFPDGRYVQVGAAKDRVLLISDPLTEIETEAGRWLDKTFFRIEKPKNISVTYPETTNSWAIQRETESAEWQWTAPQGDEKLDAGKVGGVASPFASPSFNDVSIGLAAEESGLNQPTVIKVATFDGFDYTVNVGAKRDDHYLVTLSVAGNFLKERTPVADETAEAKAAAEKEFAANRTKLEEKLKQESAFTKWTYQIPTWTVDSLLKTRSELLSDPAPAPESQTNADPPEEASAETE